MWEQFLQYFSVVPCMCEWPCFLLELRKGKMQPGHLSHPHPCLVQWRGGVMLNKSQSPIKNKLRAVNIFPSSVLHLLSCNADFELFSGIAPSSIMKNCIIYLCLKIWRWRVKPIMNIILRLLSNINTIMAAEFAVQSNMIRWEQVVLHIGSCRVCGGHISVFLLLHHLSVSCLDRSNASTQMSPCNFSGINTMLTLCHLPFVPKQLHKHVHGEELQEGIWG